MVNLQRLLTILLAVLACGGHDAALAESSARFCYEKGRAFSQNKQYKEALPYLDFSLKSDRRYGPALVERAAVYLILQRTEDAIKDCSAVISQPSLPASTRAKAFRILAECHALNGKFKMAAKDMDGAIRLDPIRKYFVYRADLRKELNEIDQAISDYSIAVSKSPKDSPGEYWKRGSLYVSKRLFADAIRDFSSSLEQSKKNREKKYVSRAGAFLRQDSMSRPLATAQKHWST